MTLVHWDPFRDLSTLHDRLGRLARNRRESVEDGLGGRRPAVDVFEKDGDLVIRAELPGVETADIDVKVENGNLVLRGERRRESEIEEAKAYRLERVYGTFVRSFALPTTVDASKIRARHCNGVLEIVVPKAEEAKAKKVRIKVA